METLGPVSGTSKNPEYSHCHCVRDGSVSETNSYDPAPKLRLERLAHKILWPRPAKTIVYGN